MRIRSLSLIAGVVCCLASSLSALECFVEARTAYFLPTGHRLKKIYGGGALYGVELDVQAYKQLYGWANLGYFGRSGRTLLDRDRTWLNMVPMSVGFKFIYNQHEWAPAWSPYVAVGAEATYLNVHSRSKFLVHSESDWGFGGVFKGGVMIHPATSHWLLDVYAEYSHMKVDMDRSHGKRVSIHRADLSGYLFGGALGYRF